MAMVQVRCKQVLKRKGGEANPFMIVKIALTVAPIALALFLVNYSMFIFLRLIRHSKTRKMKVFFAKIARYVMKVHLPFALVGTGLILVHAVIMMFYHPLSILALTKLSGMLALMMLWIHLYSGYLKLKRTSRKRQRIHVLTAFTLLITILIHIL